MYSRATKCRDSHNSGPDGIPIRLLAVENENLGECGKHQFNLLKTFLVIEVLMCGIMNGLACRLVAYSSTAVDPDSHMHVGLHGLTDIQWGSAFKWLNFLP